MVEEATKQLTSLYRDSCARLALPDRKSVESAFGGPGLDLNKVLSGKLKSLVHSVDETSLRSGDLLMVARNIMYRYAVYGEDSACIGVAQAIRFPFSPNEYILPLDDSRWREAIDVARAIFVLNPFLSTFRGRHANVAEAAKRLLARGIRIEAREERFEFADGELERSTTLIQSNISKLGPPSFLSNALGHIKFVSTAYGKLFVSPHNDTDWDRMPSIPFNFLINLAIGTPRVSENHNAEAIWKDTLQLASDLIGALDLEPYHQLESINVRGEELILLLREMALFDNLFTFRQWPIGKVYLIYRRSLVRNETSG